VTTLANHNFLELDGLTGNYRLGFASIELARSYQSGSELLQVARNELLQLRDATSETVHLAVLDGMEVVYLEKLEGLHAIGLMSSRVGRRAPAYCTAVGKALLAQEEWNDIRSNTDWAVLIRFNERTIVEPEALLTELEITRKRGFALDSGEHESEVRCVAAPIFDHSGEVCAAISVSGPRNRMDPVEQNDELIRLTIQTARAISSRLGYVPK
jgi:DNA-binding IclR family transcriptional regulator